MDWKLADIKAVIHKNLGGFSNIRAGIATTKNMNIVVKNQQATDCFKRHTEHFICMHLTCMVINLLMLIVVDLLAYSKDGSLYYIVHTVIQTFLY